MKAKILIVDDEPNVLSSLERVLRRDGYDIVQAEGGNEAIAALDEHEDLAVIVCDQRMPDLSGLEVLRHARYKKPEVVRIALTGYADMETILQCVNEARIALFVLKPWEDEALLQVVCEGVTIHGMKAENKRLHEVTYEQNQKLQSLNTNLEQKVAERTTALVNAQQKLEETLYGVICTLSDLMEMHAANLRGHGKRVAVLSRLLAKALKQPPAEVSLIESAALLHDIGKISISTDLLSKQGLRLKKGERRVIQRHPLRGYELLKDISGFEKVAQMVRHHHEKYSGQGYPDGLVGDDIPLGSRIISIANAFDRHLFPVGRAVIGSHKDAEVSLKKAKGNSLDGELVNVFLKEVLPKCKEFDLREIEVSVEMLSAGMVLARDVVNVNSVPLLKSGTRLDDTMIEKLGGKDDFDPIFSRIYITGGSMPQEMDAVESSEESEPEAGDNGHEGQITPPGDGKPTVVVVDDQRHVVNALKRELYNAGYNAVGYTSVQDALHYIHNDKGVFALITDFMMPGVTGDKFLMEVQKERPALPCIVITGMATADTIQKLTESAKVTRVIPKPWDSDILLETLESFKKPRGEEAEKAEATVAE